MEKSTEFKLVETWIYLQGLQEDSDEFNRNFWAEEDLQDKTRNEPDIAWKIILEILDNDNSIHIMARLSAGPLENLLAQHGEKFIDEIERVAKSNQKFNMLLGGVWKNDINDDVWHRLNAVRKHVW